MVYSDLKWPLTASDGLKLTNLYMWLQMVLHDLKWPQMTSDDLKQPQMILESLDNL